MIRRILKIVKAHIRHSTQGWNFKDSNSSTYYEKRYASSDNFSSDQPSQTSLNVDQQVIDDLACFGLRPPSSLKEVTAARNREMLKYHPDKFASTPEKTQYANNIALIYNAAFERLKLHFSKKE
jgi:hypothetical protein